MAETIILKKILMITGSKSDFRYLRELVGLLRRAGVGYDVQAISCHRNLAELVKFLSGDNLKQVEVIVAVARSVANLPAIVAGYTKRMPVVVIGVGLPGSNLAGMDSLLAVNTIPKGVPLLNTGIGEVGLYNAGLAALKILGIEIMDN